MTPSYFPQRRPSWRGVVAGLVMGLIVVMAMIALALVLSSLLPFDLKGSSIAGGIYAAITALVSAYVAGYFAIKYSAPEALFGDGTDIDPKDATLTGMLTGALIILLTTFFAMSSATSILSMAGNVVGSTVSTVAKTAATTATVGATAAGAASQSNSVQQKAEEVYQRVSGDISKEDVQAMVAKNTQNLNQQQIAAVSNVIKDMFDQTKTQVNNMDFTDLNTWRNIDVYAKERMASIEETLKGPEIITRLQQQGLTQTQALEVRTEVQQSFNEYKVKTEQYIAEAKQMAEQRMQQAEDVARKTALYTGLFWLISALLTFIASTIGAKNAAANYRLAKPIITWGDNIK
ncbi:MULTISPECIES: hypothetical protein [Gammaproteobacteria]|jgi:hypothetical protein|uniref:Uncharacterized protein n=1 Tax=Shewanella electrodiphila TaxID=934143 RepID=A0ABT0KWG1_9GAMM|nr:hypothetical protein [Shewanella electrodiphila]MBR5494482.1 hypothetical protein [Psychrobacter sp.]MCL1047906.1 hypothetical protein [Shewanella electrodiphila]